MKHCTDARPWGVQSGGIIQRGDAMLQSELLRLPAERVHVTSGQDRSESSFYRPAGKEIPAMPIRAVDQQRSVLHFSYRLLATSAVTTVADLPVFAPVNVD